MAAPEHIRAVLDTLQIRNGSTCALQTLPESQWDRLLEWCDARQLTLLLYGQFTDLLPDGLRARMEAKRSRYLVRFGRIKDELFTVGDVLSRAGLPFCVLKGFTHSPLLTRDPITRAQGDIDLWLQPDSIGEAKRILLELGYRPTCSAKSRHMDPMARPTNWQWRGDRFDPEMPISVELHYELWSDEAERIRVPGQEDFWRRVVSRSFDRHELNVLCDADLVGFAALHVLLHVLHGELPIQRAWEIANFLHAHAADDDFWSHWRRAHAPELRQLESVVFALVASWFDCDWPAALDPELQSVRPAVASWLQRFSLSPLRREWEPNKDELWLHLALTPAFTSKVRILLKRLIPIGGSTFEIARVKHHGATFLPTILQGLRLLSLRAPYSPRVFTTENARNGSGQNE